VAHWERCTAAVVVDGLRGRTRVEAIFVELGRPLSKRAREGRTAGPGTASEASGVVGGCYLEIVSCVRARDLGVMECEGKRECC
jgi:hypothetical protein